MESDKTSLKSKSMSRKKNYNNGQDLEINPNITPLNVADLEKKQRDELISLAENKSIEQADRRA